MTNRNLALDGMRGWFLAIMAINHLFGAYVRTFTAEPFGPASAAEGFVLLSGIVFAMVYGQRERIFAVTGKRLWFVYRWQLIGVAAIVVSCFAMPVLYEAIWAPYFNMAMLDSNPIQKIAGLVTLTVVPSYMDVLVIYLLSLALAAIGLTLLRKGLGMLWLLISGALWVAAKWLQSDLFHPLFFAVFENISMATGYFDILAWQFLFQIGLVLGYSAKYQNVNFYLDNRIFNGAVVFVIAAVTVLSQLNRHELIAIPVLHPVSIDTPLNSMFGNDTPELGLLRIAYTLTLAYGAMLLVRHVPKIFTMKYFVFIGQHSIQVFVFHAVAVYWLAAVTYPINQESWIADVLFSFGFAASLVIPAYLHSLWQKRMKNRKAQTA